MRSLWLKFYPQDWQSDEGLQMASLAARGLWIEMLCIMHKNSGYLSVGNQPVTEAHLAIKVGTQVEQVTQLLSELETLGVFSRTRSGVIYSRRMLADVKKSQTAKNNGKNGGNPNLCNKREIPALVNPPDKPPDIQPKILESRILEREKEKNNKKEKASEFEAFWGLCPRKVGKGAAEKSYWRARREVSMDQLHGAMKAHKSEVSGREKEFIPHPATWLNQKRWQDEGAPVQTTEGWPEWKYHLAARITESAVHSWFNAVEIRDGKMVMPSKFKAEWVKNNYLPDVQKIFGDIEIIF